MGPGGPDGVLGLYLPPVEHLFVRVDEDYPSPVRVDVWVGRSEYFVNELVQFRGCLYAGGTAAQDEDSIRELPVRGPLTRLVPRAPPRNMVRRMVSVHTTPTTRALSSVLFARVPPRPVGQIEVLEPLTRTVRHLYHESESCPLRTARGLFRPESLGSGLWRPALAGFGRLPIQPALGEDVYAVEYDPEKQ